MEALAKGLYIYIAFIVYCAAAGTLIVLKAFGAVVWSWPKATAMIWVPFGLIAVLSIVSLITEGIRRLREFRQREPERDEVGA